ncbi:hypothetical protein TOPH_00023 [Tolypocladium ophioglossoides CBS 100239]|uniref:Uncharacterized protein n=1 Tax=Tolypocladium ophioglossoides (strain CBS 100239) TaxID=1163406 RepID=A0A0L0NKY5_TOLOC|nr:hypothetical protein TOPH_00023 [Tolypocladium ophioglossoides CBS 100239]
MGLKNPSSMPPPPPPPPAFKGAAPRPAPKPPTVAARGPAGAFLVELFVYNGSPFKDHWAYFVRSNDQSSKGVRVHATGDVRNSFKLEMERMLDVLATDNPPTTRIPLQWVDAQYFDERAMFNSGNYKVDSVPVCRFEASAHKVKAPGKSLNSVDKATPRKNVVQKDCQTWIVESADQLVADHVFNAEVAAYLHAIQQ